MTITRLALAGAVALSLGTSAFAQSLAPTVPSPSNPFPANPVATNGTPLRLNNNTAPALDTGRSAYVGGPAGLFDGAVGTAGAIVGTGLNTAGTIVSSGVDAAGTVTGVR